MSTLFNRLSNNKSFLKGASASLIDQALLSLVNLAVGMAFIRFANKENYAIYAQVSALVFLSTSVQSALINSPALTMLPRATLDKRGNLAGSFFLLQAIFSIAFAIVFGVTTAIAPNILSISSTTITLTIVLGITVWVAWLRDFIRNQLFINLNASACLKLDITYSILICAGFISLAWQDNVNADTVLLMMGLIGGVTAIPWLFNAGIHFHKNKNDVLNTLNQAWKLARWSLPGGLVSWAFGNGYVLITAHILGPADTAEIVAARLFVSPLGMAYLAFNNIFRPRASHWLAEGNHKTVTQVSYGAILAIILLVVLYVAILLLIYPFLETHLLGEKYSGLIKDIAWWGGFFLASGIAGIGTGVLLALGCFKETFYSAIAGCFVSIPLMFIFGQMQGKSGILLGLTIGELITAAWLYIAMRRELNNQEARIQA